MKAKVGVGLPVGPARRRGGGDALGAGTTRVSPPRQCRQRRPLATDVPRGSRVSFDEMDMLASIALIAS